MEGFIQKRKDFLIMKKTYKQLQQLPMNQNKRKLGILAICKANAPIVKPSNLKIKVL